VSGGFVLNGLNTAALAGGQPLRYKYLRVHETVFRRVRGNWYAGVGYHLDWHTNIVDELLDTSATPPVVTSHYAYSTVEGFSPKGYTVSAFSLNALYESRDHTLDPYRGRYLHLAYQVAPTWLGSSRASSRAYAEYRIYVPVSTRPRHLVAFWAFADAVVTGAVPYLDLPAIGYDTRGRSGRGYAAGRFRGTALVYGEVEYRFPLTRSGLLGGVAFVNATTTSRPRVELPSLGVNDPGVPLFRSVKPAGGVGLRVMADRQARMNIVLDFGFGVDGSTGVYVSVGEAF
jgi:outer membrane protein assembly factor BamA